MQTIIIKRPGTDTGVDVPIDDKGNLFWPASGEPTTLAQIDRLPFVA
jgi:hypothetical protein